jgi:hypothetical protein
VYIDVRFVYINLMDTNTLTDLTAVHTLTDAVETGDGSYYRYLVKVTWEWNTEFYVIETPIDTDDAEAIQRLFSAVYPRDEGISVFEVLTQF